MYGKECSYRHCAPTEEDETQMDAPRDCFGRDRHGSFRDDMGGTGTWNKECKTLYIGRLCATPPEERIVETLARHFGEFGLIDSLRALKSKGCGFVTFRMRCTAEFAKEAMAEQSLDNDEQVNIRWAYDDPNPREQAARLDVRDLRVAERVRRLDAEVRAAAQRGSATRRRARARQG